MLGGEKWDMVQRVFCMWWYLKLWDWIKISRNAKRVVREVERTEESIRVFLWELTFSEGTAGGPALIQTHRIIMVSWDKRIMEGKLSRLWMAA